MSNYNGFAFPGFEHVDKTIDEHYDKHQAMLRCQRCANFGHGCRGGEQSCGAFRPTSYR